jgi:hypothetical protein
MDGLVPDRVVELVTAQRIVGIIAGDVNMAEYTNAKFLQDPKKKTPVLQKTAVLDGLPAQTP